MSESSPPGTSPPPVGPEEEDDGEELIHGRMADDYREITELDTYDRDDLDDGEYAPMDVDDRRAAERAMHERDRRMGRARRGRLPAALMSPEDEDIPATLQQRRLLELGDAAEAPIGQVNLEDYQGPMREFLEEERVRREVKARFRNFLTSFTDDTDTPVYLQATQQMVADNKRSLMISYWHLSDQFPELAIWVADCPDIMLQLFDEVAMEVVLHQYPQYRDIQKHVNVRIGNLPLEDELRNLRQMHLNAFVHVNGVVTRRTTVFPQLVLVKFDCLKCGNVIGPFTQQGGGGKEVRPPSCPDCQSRGPFRVNEAQTVYRNFQRISLQEPPGQVPAGRIPRSREVILVDDLVDMVRPGELIKVTGIYKNVHDPHQNAAQGFPVFSTVIEANHIVGQTDLYAQHVITDEDKQQIEQLGKRPDIEDLILASVAPSIFGHENIKRAIAYSLFGGVHKRHKNKHRVRADINILILGDPGTAKSQFLKYVERMAHRAVYATGKGASSAGLTAAVRRDPITREWTLEGGALVLADNGICLIDEFDKMNDKDRTSIHEAMEQQSISISKAGIVATLQARAAVIAAANPLRGRYDGSLTFVENVDLTDPILSRFDVLAVVRDRVDAAQDERLADFVVGNHIASHHIKEGQTAEEAAAEAEEDEDGDVVMGDEEQSKQEDSPLTQAMLRKYIMYAKAERHPQLHRIDQDKIAKFYAELRQKSMEGGGIPIAVRHIESIIRLAEARARLHLRNLVHDEDVDMAIRVLLESFIDTQKQSVQTSLRRHFSAYLSYRRDAIELVLHILNQEVQDELPYLHDPDPSVVEVNVDRVQHRLDQVHLAKIQHYFREAAGGDRLRNEGYELDQRKKVVRKTLA